MHINDTYFYLAWISSFRVRLASTNKIGLSFKIWAAELGNNKYQCIAKLMAYTLTAPCHN